MTDGTLGGLPRVPDVDYRREIDGYVTSFRPGTDSASKAVVEAVASVKQCDVLDLEPLYRAVDTDALDALFERDPDPNLSVNFTLGGCEVTVHGTGRIDVVVSDGARV